MSCYREQIDLLIPNICWMDVASGKKICFHNSPGDPGKKHLIWFCALCTSQLLKNFLTWSSFLWNSAMGSDLISIKSAKDNIECLSLFCVLCLYVPCWLSSRSTIFLLFLSSFCCQHTLTSLSQLQLS